MQKNLLISKSACAEIDFFKTLEQSYGFRQLYKIFSHRKYDFLFFCKLPMHSLKCSNGKALVSKLKEIFFLVGRRSDFRANILLSGFFTLMI